MNIENEYVPYIPLQGAAKVSIIMIGQQAIVDAYLCLIHLTAGILVGKVLKSPNKLLEFLYNHLRYLYKNSFFIVQIISRNLVD